MTNPQFGNKLREYNREAKRKSRERLGNNNYLKPKPAVEFLECDVCETFLLASQVKVEMYILELPFSTCPDCGWRSAITASGTSKAQSQYYGAYIRVTRDRHNGILTGTPF